MKLPLWCRMLAHYAYGALTGIWIYFNAAASALLAALFIIYEAVEYVKKRDTLYLELQDFLIGIFAGSLGVWIMLIIEKLI